MTVHVSLKDPVLAEPIVVRDEQIRDVAARESLLDADRKSVV